MTIEAETLVELTEVLQDKGMIMLTDATFIRAPYRNNHRWVCSVE